ncbi:MULTISPECIES: DUF4331 domain-containing protein [Actinoplanes]|uniref:DUF4331 domain-containing protein n=1 Tax=Actinoplanes TaxID=1865 RepID=UPI0005F2ACC7|nr:MULTISPECIES: DUF4331 domain-containing protein [Actinoplanes]GLY04128.1 hypothetical protein Acsp01_45070 [Actinoplanes sp. NBRC 101535]
MKLIAVALTGLTALTALGPAPVAASSHREAPLIADTPKLDNTDLYAFVSPDATGTVTVIANWQPFQEPDGGPNFYPFATDTVHDINIDNNGDAEADITYRWTFRTTRRNVNTFLYNTGPVTSLDDPHLNVRQRYTLQRITEDKTTTLLKDALVAPSYTGKASMPDYAALSNAAITPFAGPSGSNGVKGKSFAGQADDPFFADLRVFDLLYGADLSEVGKDTLRGYNVNTIALQVSKYDLALKTNPAANPVIGIWSTTSRLGASVKGKPATWQQVSRLGNPLVNEAVLPLSRKNEFNASEPSGDTRFLPAVVTPELPVLMEAIYKIPAPATPRNDLVEVFLTGVCKACGPVQADLNSQRLNRDVKADKFKPSEQLRLNMKVPVAETPDRMGVLGGDLAGFPNGRRLTDDVLDIAVRAAEGVLLADHNTAVDTLGDGVDANEHEFRPAFPYVALPNTTSVNES